MQAFQRALHTEYGRIVISILLGLGLSSLFRKACKGTNCIQFKAPSVKELEKDIFKHGETCHKFRAVTKNCELPEKKRILFA